jgi:glutathione synthase/RimK-type ligase-like ATP-grasp enzyme
LRLKKKGMKFFILSQIVFFLILTNPCAEFSHISVKYEKSSWYEKGENNISSLDFFDAILMRQDPPFDMDFINNTYILEAATKLGVKVFNHPKALRDNNEKLAILDYPFFDYRYHSFFFKRDY